MIYATNAFGIDAYPTYKIYSMAMDGSDRKAIKDLVSLKTLPLAPGCTVDMFTTMREIILQEI